MRITRVLSAVVEANFDWTFVRVETDSGLEGLGEAFFAPGLTSIIRELESFLQGKEPRQVNRLTRDMYHAASASGIGGAVYHAISAIEAALWDILGQSLGAPLWQLWGGSYRDSIAIYADCHGGDALESLDSLLQPREVGWSTSSSQWSIETGSLTEEALQAYAPEAYGRAAKEMVDQGFKTLKFDLDVPNPHRTDRYARSINHREIRYMASLVEGVRSAVGDAVDLAVDCHWKFSAEDTVHLARALADYDLLWLEDPVPPDNLETLKWVRRHSPVPILSGENGYGFHEFRPLIEQQAVAIVAPDLQKVGGLSEARRIADLADSYTIPLAPHNIASPVGTLAAVHLAAAIPNFLALEWHGSSVPFWNEIVSEEPLIVDGSIEVPTAPGLGVRLNEEVARKYRKDDFPFLE